MQAPDRFDPYRVLQVPRDASPTAIARAYRLLAKRHHPDLAGSGDAGEMRQLNRAWEILSNPARRGEWERSHPLPVGGPHWSPLPPNRSREQPAVQAPAGGWTAWERSGPFAAEAAPASRVRPVDEWSERLTPSAPAVATLRDSAWLALAVAGVLVAAVVVLGWIGSTVRVAGSARDAVRMLGVEPSNLVGLDPERSAAVYTTSRGALGVAVAELADDGWRATMLAEVEGAGTFSVVYVRNGQSSAAEWPALVFGRAHPSVDRVELAGVEAVGGDVSGGTWLIGLRERMPPEELAWQFVLRDGTLLLEGRGPLGD